MCIRWWASADSVKGTQGGTVSNAPGEHLTAAEWRGLWFITTIAVLLAGATLWALWR